MAERYYATNECSLKTEEYENTEIQARVAEFNLNVEAAIEPTATEADFVDKLEEFQTPTLRTKVRNPPSSLIVTILTPSTNT